MSGDQAHPTPQKLTIRDIARHTGYSRSLISIVMRDAPGASDETRAQVLAAMEELGYRPDFRARSLGGSRSHVIGVVFGIAGTFHFNLLDGLYAAAERHHYGLVLSAITPLRDEAKAIQTLQGFRFDGLVMLGPAVAIPVMTGKTPLAVVGWKPDSEAVDSVRTSDDRGMHLAVEHLVARGHRHIAHIDGGETLISRSRSDAFVEAMRNHRLKDTARIAHGGETQLAGQQGARALLQDSAETTAVIGFNDDVAIGALSTFMQAGVSVPEQMSVIGWDDTDTAGLAPVPLTTVAQRPFEMAERAFQELIDRIEGRTSAPVDVVLEPSLVVRESTSRPQ